MSQETAASAQEVSASSQEQTAAMEEVASSAANPSITWCKHVHFWKSNQEVMVLIRMSWVIFQGIDFEDKDMLYYIDSESRRAIHAVRQAQPYLDYGVNLCLSTEMSVFMHCSVSS